MFRSRTTILFSLLFLASVLGANSQTPDVTPTPKVNDSVERVETEEIKLNITAYNADGDFVTDVKIEDIAILENNRIHQPSSVRRTPANVLILLDVGNEISYAKRRKITVETAAGLVGYLHKEDSIAVMQYGDKVEIVADWTKDKSLILPKLDERKIGFGKRSAFISALDKAVNYFRDAAIDNRHLVIISDGVDSFNDKKAKESAMKNLLSSDINVHVVSYTRLQQNAIEQTKKSSAATKKVDLPPGAEPPIRGTTPTFRIGSINLDREMIRKRKEQSARLKSGEDFLTTISEDTNGEIFLPETEEEIRQKPFQLAKNIDSQYVITYTPKRPLSESPDGETRLIEAVSRRQGLAVQGKRKFVVIKR